MVVRSWSIDKHADTGECVVALRVSAEGYEPKSISGTLKVRLSTGAPISGVNLWEVRVVQKTISSVCNPPSWFSSLSLYMHHCSIGAQLRSSKEELQERLVCSSPTVGRTVRYDKSSYRWTILNLNRAHFDTNLMHKCISSKLIRFEYTYKCVIIRRINIW